MAHEDAQSNDEPMQHMHSENMDMSDDMSHENRTVRHHSMAHDAHNDMNMSGMNHEHMDGQSQKHADMDMSQMHHNHMNMDMGGMDMSHMNHDDMMMHGGHMMHMGNMKRKLWVSLILTIPIIIFSPMMGMNLPFTVTGVPGQNWLVLILGTILFFYGGQPFFSGAKGELEAKKPAMMMLITLGISVAYFYSVYATIMNAVHPSAHVMDFFWELASLIDIMLIGHIVEMNTVMKAGSSVDALAQLVPKQAHIQEQDGQTRDVDPKDLKPGDVVLVKENERVPADGKILSGSPVLDESLLTGESKGVTKQVDDEVVGGSQNQNQSFTMKVTKAGDSGYLSQVQALVSNAQSHKSDAENLADKVAGWLFYAATGIAFIALVVWTIARGFTFALPIVVTVLIIACPHALGLAIPLVASRMTGLAAKHGLLIQNRNALESINQVKYILMDKTGTLTEGHFKVQNVKVLDDQVTENDVLRLAGALEKGSTHPLALGIVEAAQNAGISDFPEVEDFENIPGTGVTGKINGHSVAVVNAKYLDEHEIRFDQTAYTAQAEAGYSVSFVLDDDNVLAMLAEGDAIKAGTAEFIQSLQQMGFEPVMLTGDNQQAAQKVAKQLGINKVHAEMKPEDKIKYVKDYQEKAGAMMVGDGVNDSPALAQATIGVAIGAGTDVAISAADVILVNSKPSDILNLIKLARNTRRKMIENLWWGAGYNVIALPLAAGILIPWGFQLDPMVGAILMSLSTIIVAINAMTLKI
ncbi:heavy metal translocating P-type ATPase [Weissella uvarum]|uniref:heavy metal translocating P-type ATPase n=1 Tax=Weissella uvarum TaxID=1479233 RepID=UPI003B830A54